MSVRLTDLLSSIAAKSGLLARKCADLKALNDKLLADLEEARAETEEARKELARAQKEIDYLRISHALSASDPGDLDRSRQALSGLVRKIDRCIARLEAEE